MLDPPRVYFRPVVVLPQAGRGQQSVQRLRSQRCKGIDCQTNNMLAVHVNAPRPKAAALRAAAPHPAKSLRPNVRYSSVCRVAEAPTVAAADKAPSVRALSDG